MTSRMEKIMLALKKSLLLLAALMFLTAATWDEKPWKMTPGEFLPIIKKYNRLLVKAYKSGDAKVVKKVASDQEVDNVSRQIKEFRSNNLKALAVLKDLKITGVQRPDPSSYSIMTEEKWDNEFVDMATGKVKQKESGVLYTMIYHFRYREGKWIVYLTQPREQYQKILKSM